MATPDPELPGRGHNNPPELLPEPLPAPAQAGWRISAWCRLAAINEQMFHLLTRQGKGPHRTKLGKRLVVVTESPQAFLVRMAAENASPARPPRPTVPAEQAPAPIVVPAPRKLPTPRTARAKRARAKA
jgi:hypothetical protein